MVLDTRLRDSRRHRDKKVPQTASWVAASSLPLALLVVPLGREALDGVHPHVQHPLHLLGLPLVIEGPGALGVDWRKNRGQEPNEHRGTVGVFVLRTSADSLTPEQACGGDAQPWLANWFGLPAPL